MSWFDIQVNGYGGIDFNQDDLSAEQLHQACRLVAEQGGGGILATIITELPVRMEHRVRRLVALRAADPLAKKIIAGIHIEGPFLSTEPGYKGAHPAEALGPASELLAGRLMEAADGLLRIFTLAPEQDASNRVTRLLANAGVTVSAGHTNASLDQLRAAIDAGLKMFTHLGNGCPGILHRHDNIIQRALFLRRQLCLCFIADGIHIPFPMLRTYLDLACDAAGCLITTDANAAAGYGPGRYRIGRWEIEVGEDLAVWAPDRSHLLASAVPMPMVQEFLRQHVGLDQEAIRQLTEVSPRKAIGLPG